MKKQILNVSGGVFALLVLILLSSGCKKNEVPVELQATESQSIEKATFQKIERFISISTGVSLEKVLFNSKTEIFTIQGTEFRVSLKDITERYNHANEYKATYEK